MTPAARVAAAIEVLEDILGGEPAEKCLTRWARGNRYAGSKDRAAVRDIIFDVLRRKRTLSALGGSEAARGLLIGYLRGEGIDLEDIFGAGGYGPPALSEAEVSAARPLVSDAETYDFPDWLWPVWQADLGVQAIPAAKMLQSRGPVTLRVNLRRSSQAGAIDVLAEDGIAAVPVGDVNSALQVVENERRIKISKAFSDGLVDLQDLASQEAVAGLNIPETTRVLDYCAGGGGKALAIADRFKVSVFAHDISAARMADIPVRAARAGMNIEVLETDRLKGVAPFDVVFVDAPCSGSGTWRRAPEAKWALTSGKLIDYNTLQSKVLKAASEYAAADSTLIYATCSVFAVENRHVIEAFLAANPSWSLQRDFQRFPDADGDGFYHAVLNRVDARCG